MSRYIFPALVLVLLLLFYHLPMMKEEHETFWFVRNEFD